MKRNIVILFLFLLLSLTACGEVKSESELKKYARENYGKYEFVSSDESDDKLVCHFISKKCGFEYYVQSQRCPFDVDGEVFGYFEQTSSNYEEQYFNYILDNIEYTDDPAINDATCIVLSDIYSYIIIPDNVSDKDREIMAVVDALKENDIENRIEGDVYVKTENEETIGAYNFDSDEYLTKEELDVRYYMDRIQAYTGKEPEFVYHEKVAFDEVEGIRDVEQMNIFGKPDYQEEGVNLYYFEMDGNEYFITDYFIYAPDEEYYSRGLFYNSYTDSPVPK